jgi:hypothetical protein
MIFGKQLSPQSGAADGFAGAAKSQTAKALAVIRERRRLDGRLGDAKAPQFRTL